MFPWLYYYNPHLYIRKCKSLTISNEWLILLDSPYKGGDPAAGSPTATLLRLHPSYLSHLRRLLLQAVRSATSGATNFHDVTGGVYKTRERIQGVVADTPLLAIPTSCSRVADYNPN